MEDPLVAIIILNWNGWEDTIECLESVFQMDYINYFVVVVDNNSTDGSIDKIIDYSKGKIKINSEFIRYDPHNKPIETICINHVESETRYPIIGKLTIISNETNEGFAKGNNTALSYSMNLNPNYFLLLNNDTVVDKYFLKKLVKEGTNYNKVGFLGPKIYYYNNPKKIWCAGGKIDWKVSRGIHIGINEFDIGQYDKNRIVDYVNGAAFFIKREVIDQLGLLDEKYFLYFEETDFTLRGNSIGYKSLYVPDAHIWHKVSKSGGGIKKETGLYYITRNRWLFMKKWASNSDFLIFISLQLLGVLILPICLSIYYKDKRLLISYYKGLKDGIIN
jgi:GT2 family glycosyltransferase